MHATHPESKKQNAKNFGFRLPERWEVLSTSAGGAVGNSRRHPGKSSLDDSGWLTHAAERKGEHEDNRKDHQHFRGVKNLYASIENPPYMRLVIEDIGTGPRGYRP